jgi:hypothetical protein
MESMTCATCQTLTLLHVRSIDDTFWCDVCKKWVPCQPPRRTGGGDLVDIASS